MAAFLWVLLALCVMPAQAVDVVLASAGAPYAPTDIDKARRDPFTTLSSSQRREIVREFRALLSMGLQTSGYQNWEGREISDCQSTPGNSCRRCEIQMGQARGLYQFAAVSGVCRVRQVDVEVDAADDLLLKDLKPAAREYVGTAGQFYLDENTQAGQSSLRFVYHR